MTMKSDTKFGEKQTCCFKTDIRNLTNFDLSTGKFQKFSFYQAPFEQSIYGFSYEITEELTFVALKSDQKFGEELTSRFKIDMRNLSNFDPDPSKISKVCTLMDSFESKYIMIELKKYTGFMFDRTED